MYHDVRITMLRVRLSDDSPASKPSFPQPCPDHINPLSPTTSSFLSPLTLSLRPQLHERLQTLRHPKTSTRNLLPHILLKLRSTTQLRTLLSLTQLIRIIHQIFQKDIPFWTQHGG